MLVVVTRTPAATKERAIATTTDTPSSSTGGKVKANKHQRPTDAEQHRRSKKRAHLPPSSGWPVLPSPWTSARGGCYACSSCLPWCLAPHRGQKTKLISFFCSLSLSAQPGCTCIENNKRSFLRFSNAKRARDPLSLSW